jgi:hypothetical protein
MLYQTLMTWMIVNEIIFLLFFIPKMRVRR